MKYSKSKNLKAILTSTHELDFIMEAHNGLSAKIAEQAGFKALWGSGLSIASTLGLRDSNEASWSQVLDVIEYMSDAITIPILMDADTGYGNFNNVRILVKKLEQREISGLCIEDKIFPKTNSFIGDYQPLASVEEFCGKIMAAKDSQLDENFCVVARIEALISGLPMDEALKRACAYYKAGADAILIHSKKSDAQEILNFASLCPKEIPLIIVPTKYYKTPTEAFREARISAVIWANHSMRASYTAIQNLTQALYKSQTLINLENKIAPLADIFSLLDYAELDKSEKKYLPQH